MIKDRRHYIERLKQSLLVTKVGQETNIPKITVKPLFKGSMLPRLDQIPKPKHRKGLTKGLHRNNVGSQPRSFTAKKESNFLQEIPIEKPFMDEQSNGKAIAEENEAHECPEDQRRNNQGNLYRRATNHIIDEYLRTSCIIK